MLVEAIKCIHMRKKLSALGYDACVFADDDKYIELKRDQKNLLFQQIYRYSCVRKGIV